MVIFKTLTVSGMNSGHYQVEVVHADGVLARMVGLLFRKKLSAVEGILIEPCNSIHTFFMSFAIDVIYLRRVNNRAHKNPHLFEVLEVNRYVFPWRLHLPRLRSHAVLELSIENKIQLQKGDQLCLS